MGLTIREASESIARGEKPKGWRALLIRVRRIFTFTHERDNRVVRFAKIVKGYAEGRMVNDLAKEFGCSRGTVLRYARIAGLPKRDKFFDPAIRRGVIAMYEQEKPIAEIAARFGTSEAYVSKTASEEGIARRKFKTRRK